MRWNVVFNPEGWGLIRNNKKANTIDPIKNMITIFIQDESSYSGYSFLILLGVFIKEFHNAQHMTILLPYVLSVTSLPNCPTWFFTNKHVQDKLTQSEHVLGIKASGHFAPF